MAADSIQPIHYLDKAMNSLRDPGLLPDDRGMAPIVGLLGQISDLDPNRVTLIARTLD